jgi:hypothetical protein
LANVRIGLRPAGGDGVDAAREARIADGAYDDVRPLRLQREPRRHRQTYIGRHEALGGRVVLGAEDHVGLEARDPAHGLERLVEMGGPVDANHPWFLGGLEQPDRPVLLRQPVIPRQEQLHGVVEQLPALQAANRLHEEVVVPGHAHIDFACREAGRQFLAGRADQGQPYVGKALAASLHQSRHQMRARRCEDAQPEGARRARHALQLLRQHAHVLQQGARPSGQELASRRGPHPARDPLQQDEAEIALQDRDLLRHGGL